MTEPKKSAKPVSMTKASSDSVLPAARPRSVVAATVALGISAVGALGAAIGLLGQGDWLHDEQLKAQNKAISQAVSSAVASASSSHGDVASASASASQSATSAYPTAESKLQDLVHHQQNGSLLMTVVLVLAMAFLGYGVYRGRHWSRWAVVAFWFIASFIAGTFAGLLYLFALGSSTPVAFKLPAFIAAASLLAAVILVNLRSSTRFFALSRPVHAGGTERRGLFAPRTPPGGGRPAGWGATARAGRPTSALRSSAADRGEAYIQKQRAKKRSTANAEAIARGAELARSRAKASKSRRSSDS